MNPRRWEPRRESGDTKIGEQGTSYFGVFRTTEFGLDTPRRLGLRTYLAEPDRGRRCWTKEPDAQQPVYGNRRRVGGLRGKRLMRRRGEYVERTFAHVYDTGGLRRVHLRGHPNILKRLIVHAGAFNLGLLMRRVFGRGTPRGLQGRRPADLLWLALSSLVAALLPTLTGRPPRGGMPLFRSRRIELITMTSATGC